MVLRKTFHLMSSAKRTKRRNRTEKKSKRPRPVVITAIITGVLGIFTVAYIFSFFRQVTVESDSKLPESVVRVQVLNGCGVKGLAEKVGDYLRGIEEEEIAFDVVEVKNAPTFGFNRTLAVSRNVQKKTGGTYC